MEDTSNLEYYKEYYKNLRNMCDRGQDHWTFQNRFLVTLVETVCHFSLQPVKWFLRFVISEKLNGIPLIV